MLYDPYNCANRNCCLLLAVSLQFAEDLAPIKSSHLSGICVKMETRIDKPTIGCCDVSGHAEKSCGILERGNGVVWNANMMCKLAGETDTSSRSRFIDIKTVNPKASNSQFNLTNANLQAPLCNRAPRMLPANCPLTSQVLPFAALGSIPLLNRGYLGSSHLYYSNGNMGSLGHFIKPTQAQLNKVDVQLSEVCQRRFVMFDHSGNKRRMIFHPAMVNEFSALLPSSLQTKAMCNLWPLSEKCGFGNDTNLGRSSFPGCRSPFTALSPYNNSHLMPTHAALDSLSSACDNCDTPLVVGENAEAKIDMSYLDCSPELSCFSHENTEDLEALLSSDEDEVSSTGHSPSDLTTKNFPPTATPGTSEAYTVCNSKKRKREFEAHVDDDTCSTATSGDNMCRELSSQKVGITGDNSARIKEGLAFHEASPLRPMAFDPTAFDILFPDEVSSSSSANNQGGCKKVPASLQQLQEEPPPEQSRKEKIKSILRLLRGIIPGGESMDTAFVLDEAIQYVRTLQSEVWKLKARKLT